MARPLKPSLTEPYLKTHRAKTHLNELRDKLNAFRESKPYGIFRKENRGYLLDSGGPNL